MTEEIIIDGVNVAGCALFYNAYNENMCARVDGLTCSEDDNCYYKQLKRLEQDSKQLTQWLDEARRNADFWCDKCTSLEQENKELKELNKKICEDWEKEIKVYWNALEEIRTYLNTLSNIDNDFPNTETYLRIQDKINEVLK